MRLITGNDLSTGDVIWWAGDEKWTRLLPEAQDAGDNAEDILATEAAAQRVNEGYIIAAEMGENGPVPAHIKDRIRALGQQCGWIWRISWTLKL